MFRSELFKFRLIFSGLCAAAVASGMAGCGGGDSSGSGDSAAPAASGTDAAAPADGGAAAGGAMMPPGMMPPGDASGEVAAADGDAAASPGPPGMMGFGMPDKSRRGGAGDESADATVSAVSAPQITLRPADFASWTDQNFEDAVRERDPAVITAIDAKVKSAPRDPKVAELLTKLLAVSAEPPIAPAAQGFGESGMAPGSRGMMPGMMPPGSSSSAPGMMVPPGMTPPGQPAPGNGAPGAGPGSVSPLKFQSRINPARSSPENQVTDSVTAMIMESLVAYQQPAVGAVRGMLPAPGGAFPGQQPPASGNESVDAAAVAMPADLSGQYDAASGSVGIPGQPSVNGGLDTTVLVNRLVDGLIQNDSPAAWQSVFALASGTMVTAVDSTLAAQIVTISLLRNQDPSRPQAEKVLLALVDGSAKLPPASRSACLRAMASVSGAAVDKLTGFTDLAFSGSTAPGATGMEGMSGMMSGMMPGMGMSRPGMPAQPGGMPGMPAGMMPPGSEMDEDGRRGSQGFAQPAAVTVDSGVPDAQLLPAVSVLWGTKSTTAIVQQLSSVSDAASAAELLALGATIPQKNVRDSVFAALSRLHSLGADSMNSAGVFRSLHDPGLLVVMKSLPRQKPTRAEGGAAAPLDSWATASEELVLNLRSQLRALSTQPGRLQATTEFPVKLHKNAVSEFSGMLVLPGPAAAALKDAVPADTRVYYARTSFVPQRVKDQEAILEHYESRASGFQRQDQAKGIIWIDGVKSTTTGIKRSVDVVIQAAGASAAPGGSEGFVGGPGMAAGGGAAGGGYTIEVMVVEISDPKVSGVSQQAALK